MRREFTKAVKVEIIKRAMSYDGDLRCEECRCAVAKGEVHHKDQDALQVDKSRKLTADDGVLLCSICHKEASKAQAPILAKALRIEAKHLGAKKVKAKIPSGPKPRGNPSPPSSARQGR